MAVLIVVFITAGIVYLILSGYSPQIVLIIAGIALMCCAVFSDASLNFVTDGYLPAKYATNSKVLDIFAVIGYLFSSRTADFGINVMAIAGFARYMNHIGASRALAELAVKPLSGIGSPYIVMAMAFITGQALSMIIPSASGLGLLLMVTLYPVLVSVGVSPLSATAVIGTTSAIGLGPASTYSIIAAENAGINIMDYFLHYQLPVGIPIILTAAAAHYFIQKYFDAREGFKAVESPLPDLCGSGKKPVYYAALPFLPLVLLLVFRGAGAGGVRINIVTAVIISVTVSVICQMLWSREPKTSCNQLKSFFDGMGTQFANVITLIVAGEVFANGLKMMGTVGSLIDWTASVNAGSGVMTIVMTCVTGLFAVILGSGHAPFIAFSSLIPEIASGVGINAAAMVLPMQFASGIMRSVSPISGVIVAVSGVGGVSPVAVVKRTALPMIAAFIVNIFLSAFIF